MCVCLFVVSTRQTFENIYFSPCDNAALLAQLALPAETLLCAPLSLDLPIPLSFSNPPPPAAWLFHLTFIFCALLRLLSIAG